MGFVITSRLDAFLAMIAGIAATIDGFVPPVKINAREYLLEAIADRIDNIASSSVEVATDEEVMAMLNRILG